MKTLSPAGSQTQLSYYPKKCTILQSVTLQNVIKTLQLTSNDNITFSTFRLLAMDGMTTAEHGYMHR